MVIPQWNLTSQSVVIFHDTFSMHWLDDIHAHVWHNELKIGLLPMWMKWVYTHVAIILVYVWPGNPRDFLSVAQVNVFR